MKTTWKDLIVIYIWNHVIDNRVVCSIIWCFTENLALHKPAWQSSTSSVSYTGAERAVDGQYTDLDVYGGQCAASGGRQTAEWRVDLGGVKKVHHVLIQHATDNKVWGTVSFNLLHSIQFNYMYYIYSFNWIEVVGCNKHTLRVYTICDRQLRVWYCICLKLCKFVKSNN